MCKVCMPACLYVQGKEGHVFSFLHGFLSERRERRGDVCKIKMEATCRATWKRHDLYASVFGKRAHVVHSDHCIAVQ